VSCCEHCCQAEGDYDSGYRDGVKDSPNLLDWTYENRHNLTAIERELLERVAQHMKNGTRL
jgi:hypothetical protein